MIDKKRIKCTTETKGVYVKLPLSAIDFMDKNNYSPTKIFKEALIELGWGD